jgi:hypothetical protein
MYLVISGSVWRLEPVSTKLHLGLKATISPSSFIPARTGILQRTDVFGRHASTDSEVPNLAEQSLEAGTCVFTESRFNNDFSKVPVHANTRATETTTTRDETIITDRDGGAPSPAPVPTPTPLTKPAAPPTVDRIDIIDSKAGAISGYPAITSGDLNSPGPFNNPATGGVNNVLQIHFHLDNGNSALVTPRREIQRTAKIGTAEMKSPPDKPAPGGIGPVAPGGFGGVLVGPEGPPAHEVKRPTTDKIVIADAPGTAALSSTDYPYTYKAHFTLTVADTAGTDIARTKYDVMIEKRSAADIPNTENRIIPVEKEDLVRKRNLP